jgi:DNA mismatch repair protein MutS
MLLCQLPQERLASELERLAPAELLTPPAIDEYKFDPARGQQRLHDVLGIAYPASVGAADAPLAVGAAGVILDYLKQNQNQVMPGSLSVRTYSPDATMPLDAATVRNLELPALTNLIDHTRTPIGARKLRSWLGAPLRDVEAIELASAVGNRIFPAVGECFGEVLKWQVPQERLVSRAAQGRSSARELVALRRSVEAIPTVKETLAACDALAVRSLAAEITDAPELAAELARALVEIRDCAPGSGAEDMTRLRHRLDASQALENGSRAWASERSHHWSPVEKSASTKSSATIESARQLHSADCISRR